MRPIGKIEAKPKHGLTTPGQPLGLNSDGAERLRAAAHDSLPVSGLTHNFYRYPARFSPVFVREAISAFTKPGDIVWDPFMGGATTLVEAMALGRQAVGCDISSLANFIATVKTRVYRDSDLARIRKWANDVPSIINIHQTAIDPKEWAERGYLRNIGRAGTWRISKAIQQALVTAENLSPRRVEDFARCIILRTAQWALDSRKKVPTVQEFRERLLICANEMIDGATEFRAAVEDAFPNKIPETICLHRSASTIGEDRAFQNLPLPKLILTSPPYPGVHVLYHRWQVDGRKETPAPFWIANQLDGAGSKFYTMGDRQEPGLRSYFENLGSIFTALRTKCDPSTMIVQMVAFASPEWQLPQYLEVMREAGFEETFIPGNESATDGRLWRTVPNRRWHADQLGETHGSKEAVLLHSPVSF